MSARRAFLRRMAGTMLGGAVTPAVLERTFTNPLPMGMEAVPQNIQSDTVAREALAAWEQEQERVRRRREALRARIGVIDYDIAERRSWGSAFKAHVQSRRECERFDEERRQSSIWSKLHDAVFGHG